MRFRPHLDWLEERTVPTLLSFTVIDQYATAFALSGVISTPIGSSAIQQQGNGSLVATYSGTIAADVTIGASSTITFETAGTDIVAENSGNWSPAPGMGGGSAPADYGAHASISGVISVSADVAIRGAHASLSSSALPLTFQGGSEYTFPTSQTLTLTAGTADYSYDAGIFGSGHGSANLANLSATNSFDPSYLFVVNGSGYNLYVLIGFVNVTVNETFSTPLGNVTATLDIQGLVAAYNITLTGDTAAGDGGLAMASLQSAGTSATVVSPRASLAAPDLTAVLLSGSQTSTGGDTSAITSDSQPALLAQPAAVDALAAELVPDVGGTF